LSGTFNPNALTREIDARKPIALQLIRSLLARDTADRELEIAGAGEGFPSGRLLVDVSRPGPGAGAELLVSRKKELPPQEPAAADPPLRRPEVPPALIGGLSYSALSGFENCGYRFYVERVLGIGEPEVAAGGDGDDASLAPEIRSRFGP